MSAILNSIFRESLPRQSRTALAAYVRKIKCESWVIPFCGRFAAAEIIAKNAPGFKTENMVTSDISLLSSAFGFYFSGQKLSALNVEVHDEKLQWLKEFWNEGAEHVASLLFAIKYVQIIIKKPYYYQAAAAEMLTNRKTFMAYFIKTVNQMNESLEGLSYEIKDAALEIDAWRDNPTALMFLNPPAYAKGYTIMFNFKGLITWAEPKIAEFIPKTDYGPMMQNLKDAAAHEIAVSVRSPTYSNLETLDREWNVCHAKTFPRKIGRATFLVSNRKKQVGTSRRIHASKGVAAPLYHDETIDKNTKVEFLPVTANEAEYYRDLWIHRLGTTGAEHNYLLLLDGRVHSVFGLWFKPAYQKLHGKRYIHEIYGISTPSGKNVSNSRLMLRLLVSKDFRAWLLDHIAALRVFTVDGVKTVCLSRLPKVRNKGRLFKLESRRKLPNGMWYLSYYTSFHNKTWRQMIVEWNDEEQRIKRLRAARQ